MLASTVSNAQVKHSQDSDAQSSRALKTSKSSLRDTTTQELKTKKRQQPETPDNKKSKSKQLVNGDHHIKKNQILRKNPGNELKTGMIPEEEILFEIKNAIESTDVSSAQDMEVCLELLMDKFSGKVSKTRIASILKVELLKNQKSNQ